MSSVVLQFTGAFKLCTYVLYFSGTPLSSVLYFSRFFNNIKKSVECHTVIFQNKPRTRTDMSRINGVPTLPCAIISSEFKVKVFSDETSLNDEIYAYPNVMKPQGKICSRKNPYYFTRWLVFLSILFVRFKSWVISISGIYAVQEGLFLCIVS